MVYLIAQTVIEYKGRGWIYFLIIAFFIVPYYINKTNYSDQKLQTTRTGYVTIYHYPMFVFGVILADFEMMEVRPLDFFRNLSLAGSIIKNSLLIFIFISYGSYNIDC